MLQSNKPLTFTDKQMHYWSGVCTNPTGTGLPVTNTNNQSKATKRSMNLKSAIPGQLMVKEILFYERNKHSIQINQPTKCINLSALLPVV